LFAISKDWDPHPDVQHRRSSRRGSQGLRAISGAHIKNLFLRNKKGDVAGGAEKAAIDLKALASAGRGRLSFGSPTADELLA